MLWWVSLGMECYLNLYLEHNVLFLQTNWVLIWFEENLRLLSNIQISFLPKLDLLALKGYFFALCLWGIVFSRVACIHFVAFSFWWVKTILSIAIFSQKSKKSGKFLYSFFSFFLFLFLAIVGWFLIFQSVFYLFFNACDWSYKKWSFSICCSSE